MKGVNQIGMRPTNIEWLRELPSHWDVASLKSVSSIQLGKMLQNQPEGDFDQLVPYLKAANVQWERVIMSELPEMWASPEEMTVYGVAPGDLVVCEGGEVGRSAIVPPFDGQCIIQNALHRIRSTKKIDLNYLLYVLRTVQSSGWFEVLCNKATIAHLTRDKLGNLRVPLPSLDQQRATCNRNAP